jgi:hypothetical protein
MGLSNASDNIDQRNVELISRSFIFFSYFKKACLPSRLYQELSSTKATPH